MTGLISDFRLALRVLRKRPGFTALAVITLGLGIGLTTTLFGVTNGIVLRPLPFAHPERLVSLCERYPGAEGGWCAISPPNVEDLAAQVPAIAAAGIGRWWPFTLRDARGSETLNGGLATPGLFRALGVKPVIGRLLQPGDLRPAGARVVVLSEAMWKSRFGGVDVLGQPLVLDGNPYTIVGVLPDGLEMPQLSGADLWTVPDFDPRDEQNRGWPGFVGYARLRDGASLDAARRQIATVAAHIGQAHVTDRQGWAIDVAPLHDLAVGGARSTAMGFLGAVFLVLLIACANVANLLLARGSERRRELAVRAALGAGRGRLIRELMTEAAVLSVAGATLGVGLAFAGVRAFHALAPAGIPRMQNVAIDASVLAFTFAVALGTTVIFGLVPALRAAGPSLEHALREGGRGTSRRGRLGSALVVSELALASLLAVSAGLLTRTYARMLRWDPGFEQSHLLTFNLFASTDHYTNPRAVGDLWIRVQQSLRALPGVRAVGAASSGPLFGGRETDQVTAGQGAGAHVGAVVWSDVSPGYFAALGVPILRGRDLSDRDVAGAPAMALVNQTMARAFWPGKDAVGQRVLMKETSQTLTVVGVVRDVPPLRPGVTVEPSVYWSDRQFPRWATFVAVRTAGDPGAVTSAVRTALLGVDADLTPGNVHTLPELAARQRVRPRFSLFVLSSVGALAVLLAAVGTYGLLAYVVAQRRAEFGVRMALGASPAMLVRSVITGGLRLALFGVAIGLAVALLLARVLASLLPGTSAFDPLALAGGAASLLVVAGAASVVPAWRAARANPVEALRSE
jgi:putative ABC transport system permease protein